MISHRTRAALTCLPVVLFALAGSACSRRAAVAEVPADPAPTASRDIAVDAELLDRGRIATAVVERLVPSGVLEVPGEVRSGEGDEAIVSTLVAGRVAELRVGPGDSVARDQVVAVVQAPEVARLRADARRLEARLAVATRGLARLRELESEGATSAATLEHAQSEVAGARADLDAVRTQLAGLGLRAEAEKPGDADAGALLPSHVLLRSPIEGAVAERKTVLGASLSPGDELYRVVANASRVVFVHVPEAKIAEVDLGARVTVRPREAAVGLAEPCVGTAERAATLVDEDRTVRVRVRLEDGCALKLAGRSLTVGLPLTSAGASSPAAVVPVAAVVELRGKHVVFVQGRDRLTFSWRAVRLGSTVGERVVVEDGVQPGERVVVRGTVLLKGELVRAEPIE